MCASAAIAWLAPSLTAQHDPTDLLLTSPLEIDKAPRLSGEYLTWTKDVGPVGSYGRVFVRHLPSGAEWDLGPGFASDISVQRLNAVGPEGCSAPRVRVAWLRLDPITDRLSLSSACLQAGSWTTVVLEPDLAWAGEVRVLENFTAWSAPNAVGRITLFLHDGVSSQAISRAGHAFRPAFAFNKLNGSMALLWDEYLGSSSGALDYEVFLSDFRPGSGWSPARNLSRAPGSADLCASADYAPDGSLWVAWQSDRGDATSHNLVLRRRPNGKVEYPATYPADAGPGLHGSVSIEVQRGTFEPSLRVDASGRVWLFAAERQGGTFGSYNKEIRYTLYDGQAWSTPEVLSTNARDERGLDLEVLGDDLFATFQTNSAISRSVDVASKLLSSEVTPRALSVSAASQPPATHTGYQLPQLPQQRTLNDPAGALRLLFGDLHSHTERSPDGMGELDHALFFARDFARLDFWASTDHDERGGNEFTDWQFQMGRRFVALFDSSDFTAFHGFEWTNDAEQPHAEVIGHRATLDSSTLYRNTDDGADALEEFYALMAAEGAIGVPHHLGKLGGATFTLFDAYVQPVTEISSVHGIYEDELVEKYATSDKRFGVTAAGDNHSATPGMDGLAGTWVLAGQALSRDAIKQALRSRRSFGVFHHGLWVDFRVNGAPMGSELAHGGPLLLEYELRELPLDTAFNVNITRHGDDLAPVHQQFVPAGHTGPVTGSARLPAVTESSWFMLRVSHAESSDSQDTIFWSTPVWVDPSHEGHGASARLATHEELDAP
ncbi:MAG: hypothetical protein DHS20C15_28920 [Planctomycetota bacterium]|nr:MAG: hypothetical protein DHS20C15_28920 [Planctomycetota bacterium]